MEVLLPSDELLMAIVSDPTPLKYYAGEYSPHVDEIINIGNSVAQNLHPDFSAAMLRHPAYFNPGHGTLYLEQLLLQNDFSTLKANAIKAYASKVSEYVDEHPELTDYGDLPTFSTATDLTHNGLQHCNTDSVSSILKSTAGFYFSPFDLERQLKRVNIDYHLPVDFRELFRIISSDEVAQTTGWRFRTVSFTGASPRNLKLIYEKAKEKKADEVFCIGSIATPSYQTISEGILHNVFIEDKPKDDTLSVLDLKFWDKYLSNREMSSTEFATRWLLALNVAHVVIAKSID